jgi:hypothetical protein
MDELLQLLLEETERQERSYWYTHGNEVEERALAALRVVVINVQRRLEEEN